MPQKTAVKKRKKLLPPAQFDSPWKDIIAAYFPQFMAFFYPQLFEMIDWSKKPVMLDKELQAITKNLMLGTRFVDKLVQVALREGGERWLLVHVEVQAERETRFEERLFIYYYRIFDAHKQSVITLAILADDHPSWRPHVYRAFVGTREILTFNFLATQLLDYRQQTALLEETANPMGIVVAAHLAALSTRHDSQSRLALKFGLTKKLYERGLGKKDVGNLYKFLDWVLTLPEALEICYNDSIHQLEEARSVNYITSAERIGIKKGIEQGIEQGIERGKQQGEYLLLLRFLELKFDTISTPYRQQLAQADAKTLLIFFDRAFKARSLEEIFADQTS